MAERLYFHRVDSLIRAIGSVLLALPLIVLATSVSAQALYDDFDGGALDPQRWRVDIATAGVRWCATSSYGSGSVPGVWQDVVAEACNGVQGMSPYGALTVSGGLASFVGPEGSAFPFVWAGPPSRPSPFPLVGDFVMEVCLRFDAIGIHGTGLHVSRWEDTEPVGDNRPVPPGQTVFNIWADGPTRLTMLDQEVPAGLPGVFHTYRLAYVAGAYTAFIDGVAVLGPTVSALRPNSLWLGNPVFAYWGDRDWTDFSVDFVRVEDLTPTRNEARSWGQAKAIHR